MIQLSLEKGCTIRTIARSLDRSASSVSRELARNNWCDPQAQAFMPGRPALAGGYRAVLAQQRACVARSSGELRTELLAALRQARKARRPRARGEGRRGEIFNMVSIHQRPPEVDDRVIPGHWKGDLIKGRGNASTVGTLVERTSLFVTLAKVAEGGAQATVEGFSTMLNRIDVQRRLSMTEDQGK